MKNRLLRILQEENMTSNKFAELMEVRPSNISHLISGRNYPNFEFIGKMLIRMPNISPDWLINGVGEMRRDAQNDLFGYPNYEATAKNIVAQENLDGFMGFDDKDTVVTFNENSLEDNNSDILMPKEYHSEDLVRIVTEVLLDSSEHYNTSNKDDQTPQPAIQYESAQQQSENVAELDNRTKIDTTVSKNIIQDPSSQINEQVLISKNEIVTNVNTLAQLVNKQNLEITQPEPPIEQNEIDQSSHNENKSSSESKLNNFNSTKQNTPAINKMVVFYDDMTFEIYNPK